MKPSWLYRTASVLLALFSVGHTLGFSKPHSQRGVDALLRSMQATRFDVQGFNRSYWDFYVGFGLFITIFLLFAAALSRQLGALDGDTLRKVRFVRWALAGCFAGVTVLSWKYFFMAPGAFSSVITLCLLCAAWPSEKERPSETRIEVSSPHHAASENT